MAKRRPSRADVRTTDVDHDRRSAESARRLDGWTVVCPFCYRIVLPRDGLLHLAIAPRLAYHLRDAHEYEAAILRIHLNAPPAEWPELVTGNPDADDAA